MTTYNVQKASRPVAVIMALALMASFWVPTLSMPSRAADDARPAQAAALVAAPAASVLM